MTVIVRASTLEDLVHRDELAALAARRGATLHEVVGPRDDVALDARALARLAPGLAEGDLYVCGPAGFTDAVVAAARDAGVPAERIHHESFAF